MLTRLRVRNFKRFQDIDIELGKAVVLIGPNNSGKTTALQALALWAAGTKRWAEKRFGKKSPEKRPGVTINRTELVPIPVPNANLLWRDLHVRDVEITRKNGKPSPKTKNVCIEIIVNGISNGEAWECGLEFDFANVESFYCRPLRIGNQAVPERMPVPSHAANVQAAFLPPMSGLSDREFLKQPGEVGVLIGQGQTAQVLRNLCFQIHSNEERQGDWKNLVVHVKNLFGVEIQKPKYHQERSEITMRYKEQSGIELDLSSSGRGLQQTLLLLTYLYANPSTVLLLDEPDAHLEILRQRQIYRLLIDVAGEMGSQIVAASHSEVVLNEAAGRNIAIAFVGKPHRINDRGSQVFKALTDIGWEQYYLAEEKGWVLYVENSTDSAILQAFARTLQHPAAEFLDRAFEHPVACNRPQRARDHFFGLQEAKEDLVGIAIFDRLDKELKSTSSLVETMWRRKEIENYFCTERVLMAFAVHDQPDNLFGAVEKSKREQIMRDAIDQLRQAAETYGKPDPWSADIKATDEFLDPLFRIYFKKLDLELTFRKSDYYVLATLVLKEDIDPEVIEKLDMIVEVAKRAKPTRE